MKNINLGYRVSISYESCLQKIYKRISESKKANQFTSIIIKAIPHKDVAIKGTM